MPAAGFYAVESYSIRFGRDGEWYSDGERIANRRIAALFSRSLRRRPEGGFMLQVGDESASVEVENTPFVIRAIDGNPEEGFVAVLNDESVETLDLQTLRVDDDNAFVCNVKGGEFEARLLRPAHYQLARWIRPAADGRFLIRCDGREYPITPR